MTDDKAQGFTEAQVAFLRKVQLVLERRFPRCRDCADENGTCPSSGLPCDLDAAFAPIRAALTAAAQAGKEAPVQSDTSDHSRDCFWASCSDRKRCANFGSCVAKHQAAHLADFPGVRDNAPTPLSRADDDQWRSTMHEITTRTNSLQNADSHLECLRQLACINLIARQALANSPTPPAPSHPPREKHDGAHIRDGASPAQSGEGEAPTLLSYQERLIWLLGDMMNNVENYFGAENPKRMGHIDIAAAHIIDEVIEPSVAALAVALTRVNQEKTGLTKSLDYAYAKIGEWRRVYDELEGRIATLTQALGRSRADQDALWAECVSKSDQIGKLYTVCNERDVLKNKLAEADKVIEPFAAAADEHNPRYNKAWNTTMIRIEDLRAARAYRDRNKGGGEMTSDQHRQLNFLASMPVGHTTMLHDDVKTILMETGGSMLACGRLYDIIAKPIGAGVYKVSLQLSNP